jgi:GMP synthase-like glutamine amidotransferase
MSSPRVLVVQHEEPTPPGLVGEWLTERGAEVEAFRIDLEERVPDPRGYALVVSLGSEFPAYDDSVPFIGRERGLLEAALEAEVPVLGICFGGQLLARVLGGSVFRAEQAEIGWLPVRSRDPARVPEGPWFQWHFDTFTLPPSAELLAESDVGPQAFVAGRNLGVQFHPEVSTGIMEDWVRVYRHELDGEGIDPDALLAETYERAERSRANAAALLEGFVTPLLSGGEEGAAPGAPAATSVSGAGRGDEPRAQGDG